MAEVLFEFLLISALGFCFQGYFLTGVSIRDCGLRGFVFNPLSLLFQSVLCGFSLTTMDSWILGFYFVWARRGSCFVLWSFQGFFGLLFCLMYVLLDVVIWLVLRLGFLPC